MKARSQGDICTPMFIAALFTITKLWEQPKFPLSNKWISKMWYIHTIGYYSAFRRKDILTHAETWIKLEDIMLNEISQSQKDKWFHLDAVLK